MVQAGAPYDYHDCVDENAEPSWTNVIKDVVKEFVGAVAESSNQLASAAEKFAAESLHSIDEAAARAERSASSSTDMAQIAQKAAEDARLAADSLQSAVNEASERIRSEASEGAAIHLTQVQEAGERLRTDLQGHVDEMVSRMTAAAGSNEAAIAAADAATTAAREAADRVQQSVSAVEAAVANAQRAADDARAAAERSETSAGTISDAVSAAQEAAEASRQSAEQASMQSTVLGGEANMLLERLETDYDLLTRLVRELHGRIASLSLPSVPSTEVAPSPEAVEDGESAIEAPVGFESINDNASAVQEVPAEAPDELEPGYRPDINDENTVWETPAQEPVAEAPFDDEPTVASTYAPEVNDQNAVSEISAEAATEPEAIAEPMTEAKPDSSYWAHLNDESSVWEVPTGEAVSEPEAVAEHEAIGEPVVEAEPESNYWPHMSDENTVWDIATTEPEVIAEPEDSEPVVEETSSYTWTPAQPVEETPAPAFEAPAYESIDAPAYESPRFEEPVYETLSPAASQEALAYEPDPEAVLEPAATEVSVRGRVQVRIAPVLDFDRLLNLDGALGRVSGVDSVTLADYAQEEVTFRVEVLGEKDAGLFTREIAVAAGVEATLVDAADNGLVIRIN